MNRSCFDDRGDNKEKDQLHNEPRLDEEGKSDAQEHQCVEYVRCISG
jgi:hypothetical protein